MDDAEDATRYPDIYDRTKQYEIHIRVIYRLGVTNIEVRNGVNQPAPEPLRVTGRMSKGEVLSYLATLERMEK